MQQVDTAASAKAAADGQTQDALDSVTAALEAVTQQQLLERQQHEQREQQLQQQLQDAEDLQQQEQQQLQEQQEQLAELCTQVGQAASQITFPNNMCIVRAGCQLT